MLFRFPPSLISNVGYQSESWVKLSLQLQVFLRQHHFFLNFISFLLEAAAAAAAAQAERVKRSEAPVRVADCRVKQDAATALSACWCECKQMRKCWSGYSKTWVAPATVCVMITSN